MDIVGPRDSEIPAPLMKTNRHAYTGKSPVRLEESTQQKSPVPVKSLPAVRPFSHVPVQKKAVEQPEEKIETIPVMKAVQSAEISEPNDAPSVESTATTMSQHPVQRAGLWDRFKAGASSVGSSISSGASSLWDKTKSGASAAGSAIASGAKTAGGAIASGASSLWDKTKSGASAAGSAIGSGASWLWDKTKSGASAAGSAIASGAKTAGSAIVSGAKSAGSTIAGGASYAWDKTKDGAGWAATKAYQGIGKAQEFANRDENINRKNTALNSGLPLIQTGAGIAGAVDTAQKGFLQQGKSAGSTFGGVLGIAGGAATGISGLSELIGAGGNDTRRSLLGAADLTSGGLSVASGALSIAGTTGAAIPGLGIASAGLDTLVQGGKGIYAHKQMNKLAAMQSRIQERNGPGFGQLSPGEGYTGDLKKQFALLNIAKEAMDVRRKQRNRAGINAVGSAVETAGHSTVVGAGVTGIGAAVGMGLVAGGKGIKAIAGLVRGAKQKMIDKGWVGKGKEDERTSENKEKRAQAFIDNVLENHADPEVEEAMEAMGANKEQMRQLKEGKLSRADIYKLYKAR
jgi:hypothetical protein